MVPPNTTAVLSLPGSDTAPIEVGSGSHRWSGPYQVPEPVRVPLTIDNTLGEIIDDPEAWAATLAAIRATVPGFAGGEIGPKGSVTMPVWAVFAHTPYRNRVLPAISSALDGLERR